MGFYGGIMETQMDKNMEHEMEAVDPFEGGLGGDM